MSARDLFLVGLSHKSAPIEVRERVALSGEALKSALNKLEQKLEEAQTKSDLLVAQHRRSRALGKAVDAKMAMDSDTHAAGFDRMKQKVARQEAVSQAKAEMAVDSLDDIDCRGTAFHRKVTRSF